VPGAGCAAADPAASPAQLRGWGVRGAALELIRHIPCDVLLSNLPREPTERLIKLLPELPIRTAIVATGESPDLDALDGHYESEVVAIVGGSDFRPPQPVWSLLIKLTRIRPHSEEHGGGSAPSSQGPASEPQSE
jgi:hypothetical protein